MAGCRFRSGHRVWELCTVTTSSEAQHFEAAPASSCNCRPPPHVGRGVRSLDEQPSVRPTVQSAASAEGALYTNATCTIGGHEVQREPVCMYVEAVWAVWLACLLPASPAAGNQTPLSLCSSVRKASAASQQQPHPAAASNRYAAGARSMTNQRPLTSVAGTSVLHDTPLDTLTTPHIHSEHHALVQPTTRRRSL